MQEALKEGTHIRGFAEYTDDKKEARITIQVWPLPPDEELLKTLFLGAKVSLTEVLVAAGIAGRKETDLTGKGPMQ